MAKMGLQWIMNVVEDADAQYQQQKDYFMESMQALVRMAGGRVPLSPLPAQFRGRREKVFGNSRQAKLARCEEDKENWEGENTHGRSELKRPLEGLEVQNGSKRSKTKQTVIQEVYRERQVDSELKQRLEDAEIQGQSKGREASRRSKSVEPVLLVQDAHRQTIEKQDLEHSQRDLKRKLETLNVERRSTSSRKKRYGVEQVEEQAKLAADINNGSKTPMAELVVPDSPEKPPAGACNVDHRIVKDVILTCSKPIQRGSGYDSICLERYNFHDEFQGSERGSVEAQNSSILKDVLDNVLESQPNENLSHERFGECVFNDNAERVSKVEDRAEQLQANGKRSGSATEFRDHADIYIHEEDGASDEPDEVNSQENVLGNIASTFDRQCAEGLPDEESEQRVQKEFAEGDDSCQQLQSRKSYPGSQSRTSVKLAGIYTPREEDSERQFNELQSVADSEADDDENQQQERMDPESQCAEASQERMDPESPCAEASQERMDPESPCAEASQERMDTESPCAEASQERMGPESQCAEASGQELKFGELAKDFGCTSEEVRKDGKEEQSQKIAADSKGEYNDNDQHAEASDHVSSHFDEFEDETEEDGQKELQQGNPAEGDEQTELQDDVAGAEVQNEDREDSLPEEQQAAPGLDLEAAKHDLEHENFNTKEEPLELVAAESWGKDQVSTEDSRKNASAAEPEYAGDDYNELDEALAKTADTEQQQGHLSIEFEEENEKKESQEDSRIQEEEGEEEEDHDADVGMNDLILQVEKEVKRSFRDFNNDQQSLGEWEDRSEYNEAPVTSKKESGQQRLDFFQHNEDEWQVKQDERPENLVANVRSFLPLVLPQQPTVSFANGKKDVRVKALEAAEAARKQEEKRAEERKARKLELINRQKTESLSLPAGVSARSKKLDAKKVEKEQRKKDEDWRKKEAEFIARKRKKEEVDKKEREDKRKKVDDVLRMKKEQEEKLRLEREGKEQRRKAVEEAFLSKKAMEEEQRRQKRLEKEKEIERRRKADEEAKASWLATKEADRKRREEAFQRMKTLEREQRRHADKAELVAATATQDLYEMEQRSTASRLSTLRPGTLLQREKSLGLVGHASRIPTGSVPRKAASLNQLRNSFNAKHSLNGTEFFAGTPGFKKSLDQRYCTPISDDLVVDEEDDEDDDGPVTYEISPYRDDDDDSDEDEDIEGDDEYAKKKPIPRWAWKDKLLPQLVRQAQIDPDRIFKSAKSCSLNEVFGTTGNRRRGDFSQRSGSGDWSLDIASWKEELQYKKSMGYL